VKVTLKNIILIGLTAVGLLTSCQKEEEEYIDDTDEETITANSTLAINLLSAAQNNGSIDNIIDGSSCVSIVLPVNVIANGQPLLIDSVSDLQTIQLIFDQYPNDLDVVEIVFPITIVYEDYSEELIENQSQLNIAISNCINFIEDTFSCIDFEYPISCFVYNTLNEQTDRVTMNNDNEWFDYLEYLTDEIVIAIDYDMTVIIDGESFVVSSNLDLENIFAQTNCTVPTTGGGTPDPEVMALRNIMKEGTWYVQLFLDDGDDETSDFAGYDFNFMETITVFATNGSQNVYGIWVVTSSNDTLNFEFDMDSPINGADDDDYEVLQFTDTSITFVTRDSHGDIEDTLTFNKN
tara:strand:+ start:33985 stop:35034 length:1050 start_codon:yes stop_codon:yes gene_type:complete